MVRSTLDKVSCNLVTEWFRDEMPYGNDEIIQLFHNRTKLAKICIIANFVCPHILSFLLLFAAYDISKYENIEV